MINILIINNIRNRKNMPSTMPFTMAMALMSTSADLALQVGVSSKSFMKRWLVKPSYAVEPISVPIKTSMTMIPTSLHVLRVLLYFSSLLWKPSGLMMDAAKLIESIGIKVCCVLFCLKEKNKKWFAVKLPVLFLWQLTLELGLTWQEFALTLCFLLFWLYNSKCFNWRNAW